MVEELFYLTDKETGVTGSDIATADIWQQGWRYQVPVDKTYIFRPGHTFSTYLEDNASDTQFTEYTSKVRVLLRDPSQIQETKLIQDTVYKTVKEFTDRDLIKRLDISSEVVAKPGYWIVIELYPSISFDASDSWFSITCDRQRLAII